MPEFILKNYGSDTLFNVLVHYQFDSGSAQSLLWVGVVPGENTVHVVLPSSTLLAEIIRFKYQLRIRMVE